MTASLAIFFHCYIFLKFLAKNIMRRVIIEQQFDRRSLRKTGLDVTLFVFLFLVGETCICVNTSRNTNHWHTITACRLSNTALAVKSVLQIAGVLLFASIELT